MTTLEREFCRSPRGPEPNDEDVWRLVFDTETARLLIRREWQTRRDAGVDELTVDEFLEQKGAAPDALIALLFGRVTAEAP